MDVTDRLLSEIDYSSLESCRIARATTASRKLTAAQAAALPELVGLRFGFVSKALVYSREIRALPAVRRKILLRLLKGGQLNVIEVVGPLDPSAPKSHIGAAERAHYLISRPE